MLLARKDPLYELWQLVFYSNTSSARFMSKIELKSSLKSLQSEEYINKYDLKTYACFLGICMIVNQKKLEKLLSDLRDYYDKIFLCKPNTIKTVQKQKKTINANIERFIMREYDSNQTALKHESQMQLLQETPRNLMTQEQLSIKIDLNSSNSQKFFLNSHSLSNALSNDTNNFKEHIQQNLRDMCPRECDNFMINEIESGNKDYPFEENYLNFKDDLNNLFISENNLNDQLHKERFCETIKKFDLTDVLKENPLFDGKKTLFSKKKRTTYTTNHTNIDPDINLTENIVRTLIFEDDEEIEKRKEEEFNQLELKNMDSTSKQIFNIIHCYKKKSRHFLEWIDKLEIKNIKKFRMIFATIRKNSEQYSTIDQLRKGESGIKGTDQKVMNSHIKVDLSSSKSEINSNFSKYYDSILKKNVFTSDFKEEELKLDENFFEEGLNMIEETTDNFTKTEAFSKNFKMNQNAVEGSEKLLKNLMSKFKFSETISFNDLIRSEKKTVKASIFMQTLTLVAKKKLDIHQDDKEIFSEISLKIVN